MERRVLQQQIRFELTVEERNGGCAGESGAGAAAAGMRANRLRDAGGHIGCRVSALADGVVVAGEALQ